MSEPLLLASQSPRRRKILSFAKIPFRVVFPLGVSEKPRRGEGPEALVRRLALEKALSVSRKHPARLVLGADTMVVQGREIFGKPRNRREAARCLGRLQGNWHVVLTGMALVAEGGRQVTTGVERTEVLFKKMRPLDYRDYLRTNEAYDKAGAYDIQGEARSWIRELRGDYFTVLGLSLGWLLREMKGLEDPKP